MDLKLLNNPNIKWPYTALEYIESTGTQYIDTLVKPKKSIGFYIDFQYTTATVQQYLFGHTYSSGTTGISYCFYINDNGCWAYAYNNGQGSWISTNVNANTNRHVLEFNVNNDKLLRIDEGDTFTGTISATPSNTSSNTVTLFARRNMSSSGTPGNYTSAKIYAFKVYDNGVLIKNMIPVISTTDNTAGLWDTIGKEFYPNQGTGNFTGGPIKSTDFCNYITSLYIKDCPNIQGINILRNSVNINRIRINIGNQSGTMKELYKYTTLSGFNDAYEQQEKPRLVGTFNITGYYSDIELDYLQSNIDGIVINAEDLTKNIDNLLETNELKVQTLDSTKPNYNPAVAIVMHNGGWGVNVDFPIVEGEGTWCMPKSLATTISTLFRGITTMVDTEGIVSNDTTAEYDFENFEEFQYFDNTSISAGSSTSALGAFGNCTKLKKITLPNTVTSIGAYGFYNCSALETISGMNNVTTIGEYAFNGCSSLQSIVIPNSVTAINSYVFCNCSSLTTLTIPNGVTSIGQQALYGCSGLTELYIPPTTSSLGYASLSNMPNLSTLNVPYLTSGSVNDYINSTNVRTGNNLGTLTVRGNVDFGGGGYGNTGVTIHFLKIFVYGNFSRSSVSAGAGLIANTILRIKGSLNNASTGTYFKDNTQRNFLEVMTDIQDAGTDIGKFRVVHLGMNNLVSKSVSSIGMGNIGIIYVGDGSSKQGDVDVLDLYLADTNWSAYSTKLSIWWDYNGEYKWYRVTENLTHCTNSNSVEWPFITRNNSYETTIIADEGCTIERVKVLMYECADNTATPATPTDITNDVYDASTGTIHIEHVIGNVEIKASAI